MTKRNDILKAAGLLAQREATASLLKQPLTGMSITLAGRNVADLIGVDQGHLSMVCEAAIRTDIEMAIADFDKKLKALGVDEETRYDPGKISTLGSTRPAPPPKKTD